MNNYLNIEYKEEEGEVYLYLNNSFHASWNAKALKQYPDSIYPQMMQCAYEQGIADAKSSMKKALGL